MQPPRLARWGTELHDRFMLPYFVEQDFADVIAEQNAAGFPLQARVVRAALRVPLPEVRRLRGARRRRRAAPGARALARDGRGGRRRRRGALRGFLGRAAAGQGRRASRRIATRSPATGDESRCGRRAPSASSSPACATRPGSRRRRCIRLIRVALAADLRPGRHVDESLDGRLPVPRRASRRPQLRHLPGERLRVREPAPGAICQNGPHAETKSHRRRDRRTSNSRSRWTCVKSDA